MLFHDAIVFYAYNQQFTRCIKYWGYSAIPYCKSNFHNTNPLTELSIPDAN